MLYLIYTLVILVATSLGAVAGLGGGVIIKPLLDLVGYHDAATINIYSSVAVFVMCCVSLTKQLRAGFEFDKKMVLSVSAGSLLGGVAGEKVFSALTGSFDNHLVKAVQAGILAVVLGLILVYTLRQDKMPSWKLTNPVTIFAAGFTLGALAVFLGIGGGPLNVAALSLLFSLGAKEGAVYSLAIIFFSQLSKLVLSASSGALWAVDLTFVPFVVIPAIAGGFIGTFGNRALSEEGVRKIYVAVMCLLPLISLYNCVTNLLAL
ncbi:MAG: sulfite exporter TauE/SafE family protein [Coriobacteriales bacterium]|nr:sulfite exporter TauE/SafE family protein [Coriobacteriales bacterium]